LPINKKTDGFYPSVTLLTSIVNVGEGGDLCSLPFVWGTSGAKAGLRPGQGVSPFPFELALGGVSIAASFLIPNVIIHGIEMGYIKKSY
jgi:hypothetical protein